MIALSRPSIGPREIAAVVEVLESGMLASGERVRRFEAEFARLVGTTEAVAVGSGTAALHVGLLALGVGPGDEVIVPSFTFAASANSVRLTGAMPVFADIDRRDYTIHADTIQGLITEKTRAVMPVHLYGQMAPMDEIAEVARRAGIDVLEDAAQAHMAESGGRRAGSVGRLGAFSFYPTKNMTTGEGGMITTSDPELAERARWLRNQGMVERYVHKVIGLNERMTEIEAAIGLVQLERLPAWTRRRREIAEIYANKLDPRLGLPHEREDAVHVYHQYTIAPEDREAVRAALRSADIGHDVYYPKATHQQDPYVGPEYRLPVSEEMADRVLSIPVRPDLTDEEIELIVTTLNGAVA
ncbi:MAG TPA: DegT/DnrJ/EryC1/StrS aminotransferase family protein [Acidimicrobiia bacterium]|nr:DegT/DnrJ/EryC1/StrS aminotransferase family protein [Acidimicrobiia bacterium]